MIVEYVRYELVSPSSAFETAYLAASKALADSPHCLRYELSRCVEAPTHYVLRIEWDSLEGHLEGFRKAPAFQTFVSEVGPFIREIVEMRHYEPTPIRMQSIAEAFGGPEAFVRLAKEMHTRMKADALLGPRFASALATHVPHLSMWLTEVFGGPALYSTLFGDIAPMLERHANLCVTEEERMRFVALASEAVNAVGSKSEERARAAMIRYFVWGSHIAVENAAQGHFPNANAGVPKWGWDD